MLQLLKVSSGYQLSNVSTKMNAIVTLHGVMILMADNTEMFCQ